MKGLYQRGNVWWFRYRVNGQQQFESTGEQDEARAIEAARLIRERVLLQGESEPKEKGLAIETAIERYIAHLKKQRLSMRYIEEGDKGLRRWQREIGLSLMRQVTAERMQKWIDEKLEKDQVKPSTIDHYLEYVRALFAYIDPRGRNPADRQGLVLPKFKANARDAWIDEEGMDQLIGVCVDKELKYILYCGFHAGLRYDEVGMSRPEWFDLERGLLTVRCEKTLNGWKPKNGKERTLRLTSEFLTFLKTEYPLRSPYMIAPTVTKGDYMYRFSFRKRFDHYLHKHGFTGYTFHDLRRSFATQRAVAGFPISHIANWLGDGLQVTLQHYAKFSPGVPIDLPPRPDNVVPMWQAVP
jgi:integrase